MVRDMMRRNLFTGDSESGQDGGWTGVIRRWKRAACPFLPDDVSLYGKVISKYHMRKALNVVEETMRSRIKNLAAALVFLILIGKAAISVTCLFRNTGYDRLHIIGMYEEGPLDMVYVGGSSTFVYWQPLKAWKDKGFTSYSYATNSLEADGTLYYMKEALKTHRPQMFVVELRSFAGIGTDVYEGGMRNGTDSMDFTSWNRWAYLYDYLGKRNIPPEADELSCYLDLMKYHTNTGNLASPTAWEYMDNRGECVNKGWEWIDAWSEVDQPVNFRTAKRTELDERTREILVKLLDFCQSQKLEVLFVLSPYCFVTQDTEALFNTVGDMVDSYGYRFLNTNHCYQEMKLDFTRDFYNGGHVNLFGAEKYTAFLQNYLEENYGLPDHRSEAAYESWNDEYERFALEEAEHKQTVEDMIAAGKKNRELAAKMRACDDFAQWEALAEHTGFTVFVAQRGTTPDVKDAIEKGILNRWQLGAGEKNALRVLCGVSVQYSNAQDQAASYAGSVGNFNKAEYVIGTDGTKAFLRISDQETSINRDGIHVAVIDNYSLEVVDSLNLTCRNGKMALSRQP